jgi:hypothetical protein
VDCIKWWRSLFTFSIRTVYIEVKYISSVFIPVIFEFTNELIYTNLYIKLIKLLKIYCKCSPNLFLSRTPFGFEKNHGSSLSCLEAHPASYILGTGSITGVMRPGNGVNHLRISSPEVKERVELYLYTTSGPLWHITGRNLPLSLPDIHAHVNVDCPDDRHPKLKIVISELILNRYQYTSLAYIPMHWVIWR